MHGLITRLRHAGLIPLGRTAICQQVISGAGHGTSISGAREIPGAAALYLADAFQVDRLAALAAGLSAPICACDRISWGSDSDPRILLRCGGPETHIRISVPNSRPSTLEPVA